MRAFAAVAAIGLLGNVVADPPLGCAFECETTVFVTVTAACSTNGSGGHTSIPQTVQLPTPSVPITATVVLGGPGHASSSVVGVPAGPDSSVQSATPAAPGSGSPGGSPAAPIPPTTLVSVPPTTFVPMPPPTLTPLPSPTGTAPCEVAVTDTFYHWLPGTDGPVLTTIFSTHTLYIPYGQPTSVPGAGTPGSDTSPVPIPGSGPVPGSVVPAPGQSVSPIGPVTVITTDVCYLLTTVGPDGQLTATSVDDLVTATVPVPTCSVPVITVITPTVYHTCALTFADGSFSQSVATTVLPVTLTVPCNPAVTTPVGLPGVPGSVPSGAVVTVTAPPVPAQTPTTPVETPGVGVPGSGTPGSGVPGSGVPGSGVPGAGIPPSYSNGIPSDNNVPPTTILGTITVTNTWLSTSSIPFTVPAPAAETVTVVAPPGVTGPSVIYGSSTTSLVPPVITVTVPAVPSVGQPGSGGGSSLYNSSPNPGVPTSVPGQPGQGTPSSGTEQPGVPLPPTYGSPVPIGVPGVPSNGVPGTPSAPVTYIPATTGAPPTGLPDSVPGTGTPGAGSSPGTYNPGANVPGADVPGQGTSSAENGQPGSGSVPGVSQPAVSYGPDAETPGFPVPVTITVSAGAPAGPSGPVTVTVPAGIPSAPSGPVIVTVSAGVPAGPSGPVTVTVPAGVPTGPPVSATTPCPSELSVTLGALETQISTSTWTDIVVRDGVTQTFYFPRLVTTVTTVASVPTPSPFAKRDDDLIARQGVPDQSQPVPATTTFVPLPETSLPSPDMPTPAVGPESSSSPSVPLGTGVPEPAPLPPTEELCGLDGEVGNFTIDFDDGVPNAPIFSPLHYLWFSEYFVVKVPGQSKYTPTSRGQLAEFVPPSRAPTTEARSSDIAQIGTGSHMSLPYFQFDWYAMNVGCESTSVPCQFSIGGYRWNPMTGAQDRVVSQDFIVPACTAPQYCPLTPIAGVGFENLTSIFVQSMSNGQAATWWVDDIHFGWSDNSCTASDGRKGAPLSVARREAIDTAIRRGIWQWTPYGIKRLASRFARRFF